MGMDISHEAGVVIPHQKVLDSLSEENRFDLIRACRLVAKDCLAQARLYPDTVREKACHWDKLKTFDNQTSIETIRAVLASVCVVHVDDRRYGHGTHVLMSEVLEETLWPAIFQLIEPDFPRLLEVRAFGDSRVAGYEVPIDEACFVFDSEPCFEKRLTPTGKRVAARFGDCVETNWTRYSV